MPAYGLRLACPASSEVFPSQARQGFRSVHPPKYEITTLISSSGGISLRLRIAELRPSAAEMFPGDKLNCMSGEMIWRYVDFPKFVGMLSTGSLWFAKAVTLSDDPWEVFGRAKTLPMREEDDLPKVTRMQTPDGTSRNYSVPQMLAKWSRATGAYVENASEHLYINSWFVGNSESMAMWDIYGSNGCGIALRSSTDRYRQAARFTISPERYCFGRVSYHDDPEVASELLYDFTETIVLPGPALWLKLLNLALHKRSCYAHEKEWRAVIYHQDVRPELRGLVELFDLTQLIDEVVVGPRAERFVVEAVAAVTEKFLPQLFVRQSTLLQRRPKVLP